MRKAATQVERALVGGIVGSMIGSSSAFTLFLLVAGVSYLLGHPVFLYAWGGIVAGAIIGSIAGAAFGWRAASEQGA
jgi:hypothetical protein